MYNLIIKEDLDPNNPYTNSIVFHDLTLQEVFELIKKTEEKDSYYYEIVSQE